MKPDRRLPDALLRAALAGGISLAAISAFSLAAGVSPGLTLSSLLTGAFGSRFAWEQTLLRATPILLAGLAVGWAFRAGLFNIGAEGQLLWGAVAAAWAGHALSLPLPIHVPLALLAAAAAGALWAWPAAYLKVRRGAPEVLTTLLLSFVAVHWTTYLANHVLHDPAQQGPRTPDILETARLPRIGGTDLHLGLALAVLAAALLLLVWRRGRFGFGVEVVGRNPEAARAAGLPVERVWTLVLLQSGALAGLAGGIEVLGIHRYFQAGFSPGYGYEGIAVAILGGSTPAGILLASLFWGGLAAGAVEMELSAGVNRYLVTIIQALVVLVVAVRKWPVPGIRKGAAVGGSQIPRDPDPDQDAAALRR